MEQLPNYDSWKLDYPQHWDRDSPMLSGCDHEWDEWGVCIHCEDESQACCDAGAIGHSGRCWREE